ncbi:MAG TPA: hypothetical protein DIC52_16440 [Candidatus Latescibacteria bacterium]|nr:hypothetical protein [Candidatus Latescibacterota bacterium]
MSYVDELDQRRQAIIADMAPKASSLFGAQALFVADITDAAQRAEEIVLSNFGSQSASPFALAQMGCFDTFGAMFLLCRWQDDMTEPARQHIKKVMTGNIHGRGNTENHWLMHYTAQLLAAERFVDVDVWWNGLPREVFLAEAKRWILGTIDRTARIGHHEYDSTDYHGWHVLPMIALADHAQDETIRHQAGSMATLLIADMALEYFKGGWAGGHAREGYRENTWTAVGCAAALLYLYFGGPTFGPMQAQQQMAPALTSFYQPPAILAAIANDRSKPRVVKKTKAPRNIYRHVHADAKPVYKTTYTSRSFALGTTQTGLPGAPAGPIDLVSWDLTWEGPKHEAKIVSCHPYVDPGRFSAFLSELPQDIGRTVPAAKPYLQFPDRLYGASPYERMMQHESSAIILYRIPVDDQHPYVNVYLPRSTTWRQQDDLLFGDAGAFFVTLRLIGEARWDSVHDADFINGWILRLRGDNVGLVIEASEKEEHDDLDAFVSACSEGSVDLSEWATGNKVGYTTRTGDRLEMTYDGEHMINGEPIDYTRWKLYEAPEATAEMASGIIQFNHAGESLTLDFEVDPAREMIPMRVIG